MMPRVPLPHMSIRRVFLIGVGTVFVIIGLVCLAAVISSIEDYFTSNYGIIAEIELIFFLAFLGVVLAAGICAALVAPMTLLWIPYSAWILRRDTPLAQATMAFVGAITLLETISFFGFLQLKYTLYYPPLSWPLVVVPVGISVFLANYFSYEHPEDGSA